MWMMFRWSFAFHNFYPQTFKERKMKIASKLKIYRFGRNTFIIALLMLASALTAAASGGDSASLLFQSPRPSLTPTFTSTPVPSLTPTPTGTSIPTLTPTPTNTSVPVRPTLTPILTPTVLPTSTPAPGGFYYTVRPGDNLFRIALRFGTTITAIAQANGIVNPGLIRVGQVLWIPGWSGGNPSVYIVQRGDTLYSIARRFGTTYQALAAANGLSNPRLIYVGQRLIIPDSGSPGPTPPPSTVYTVRPGDTLWSIALRYGTTPWAIAAANGLRNPNWIYPGQRLIIP